MMERHAVEIKAAVASFFAFLTALFGWFGWLVVALAVLAVLDYVTGSHAALKRGAWDSEKAREGIWHKVTMFLVVAGTGILDLVIGVIIERIPAIPLPFDYTVFFCPLVVVWYILTELGSLLENTVASGGNVPAFLMPLVKGLKAAVTKTGSKFTDDERGGKDGV